MAAITVISMLQIVLLAFLSSASGFSSIPNRTGSLEVYALPVGQGDCTIIQCPAGQLVINDCGSSGGRMNRLSIREVITYLGDRVSDIVAILISHAHADHYRYLPLITNHTNANIRHVIIGGKLNNYPDTRLIREWLKDFANIGKLALVNSGSSCLGSLGALTSAMMPTSASPFLLLILEVMMNPTK